MKAAVCGEVQHLRSSDRTALEKLAAKRSNPHAILNTDLARRAAELSVKLGAQIGLILGRDGRVTHVVLGSKDRLYLPDLGRFRLGKARLRRLRLIIVVPDAARILQNYPSQEAHMTNRGSSSSKREKLVFERSGKGIVAPEIAHDLITDLEKLRFDALLVIAADEKGVPGALTFAHLEPESPQASPGRSDLSGRTGIAFRYERNIHEFELDFLDFIGELEDRFTSSVDKLYDTSQEQAILVGAYTGPSREAESSMAELQELARTAGIQVVETIFQRRRAVDPKTVVGKGKIEELTLLALDRGVDLLVFDRELSPGQLRSITNMTELRVLDRSMLILDIFAQRATTSEGRLQVELAQLKYSLPRLTEKDSGLSRLTGGIGGRGPGETKLEVSRRRTRKRIADLEKRIDKLASQRALRRSRRQSRGVPVIAIVGYTNAGKSTLLNALTKGETLVEAKLFATLDPSSRRMRFPNEREVIFVDTVGFIRELPKELIAAFRATLEEVGEANVLVHLVDAADPELAQQIETVNRTLEDLGYGDKPRILALNKMDLLQSFERSSLLNNFEGLPVSAVDRSGFEQLILELQERLADSFEGVDPGQFIPHGAV